MLIVANELTESENTDRMRYDSFGVCVRKNGVFVIVFNGW